MKVLARILSLIVLLAVATLYTSCGGNEPDPKSAEETQLDKLKASSWTLIDADLGGTDRTADFDGLVLTFSGTYSTGATYQYTLTGSRPNPSPWPASGPWKFGPDPTTQMVRIDPPSDELGMGYTLTDSQLTITFNYTGAGFAGGRVEEVIGDWTFVFEN